MSCRSHRASVALAVLLSTTTLSSVAFAQSVTLPNVDVSARPEQTPPAGNHVDPDVSSLPANIPAVVEERTGAQLRESTNAITSAEMLKYFPSIEVRERAIGDTNGIIAGRTTGTVSSAETLLYGDEQLLSNLLGNSYSYPPRWGLVSPVEVSAVDVIYGPFSALYPGNAMGGVVTLSTRMPEKQEAHIELTGAMQDFKLYDTHQTYPSGHLNAAYGDKIGRLSYWFVWDHLDGSGQPLNFASQSFTPTALSTTPAKASDPVVGGAQFDTDQNGNKRAIFGAYSITHTVQDSAKVKAAIDYDNDTKLTVSLGYWNNNANVGIQPYLTTAGGTPFYNGNVNIGGQEYKVASLNPSTNTQEHLATAVALKSNTGGLFDYDLSASVYDYLYDSTRAATNYGVNSAGTNQLLTGSGWQTVDARFIVRPETNVLGTHELSFGAHYDAFQLNQHTWNTSNWTDGSNISAAGASQGDTETSAVYLQDVWRLAPRLSLTLGGRGEAWNANSGENTNTKGSYFYPTRTYSDFSPKASVGYDVTRDLDVRFSVGKAYRFPTVTELFQQVTNSNSVIINDPNLKPEEVVSYDLTSEYTWAKNRVRLSLFDQEMTNALFSQTNTTVSPNVTSVQNVGKARVDGVEAAYDGADVFIHGLEISGSVTFAKAITLADSQNPAAVNKVFPRVPDWRVRFDATYHPTEDWSFSVGARYAGRAYSSLNNTDINPNTFGGISSYFVTDVRATHKIGNGVTIAAGIDNINDCKYYVSPHPYPQTTAFLQMRWDL